MMNSIKKLSYDQKIYIRYLIRSLSFGGRNSKKQVRLFISLGAQAFSLFEIELTAEQTRNQLNYKTEELKKLKRLALILNMEPLNFVKVRACLQDLHASTRQVLTSSIQASLDSEVQWNFDYYIENKTDLAIATLERTRALFREPTGHRHSVAKLNLVRSLIRIYEMASGKKFGLGSSASLCGTSYMTPSEHLLYHTLKLVDKYTTIDGMRELFRAACRSGLSTPRKKAIKKKTRKAF